MTPNAEAEKALEWAYLTILRSPQKDRLERIREAACGFGALVASGKLSLQRAKEAMQEWDLSPAERKAAHASFEDGLKGKPYPSFPECPQPPAEAPTAQPKTNGHAEPAYEANGKDGASCESLKPSGPQSPFERTASTLLANGYSPIPIKPGTKRPLINGWSAYCETPLNEAEIARLCCENPHAGIGAACGYDGLIPLDIDTDHAETLAAIRSVLPESAVAKRGKKGRTDFYRASSGLILPRKLKGKDGRMLVEILAFGNQCVIPPTIHPGTGQAYRWLAERTLLDTPVSELPEIPADIAERLEEALKPWLAEKKPDAMYDDIKARTSDKPPDDLERKRLAGFARTKLRERCAELAVMPKDSGRNDAAFKLVSALGRFAHCGLVPEQEITGAIMAACETNGLVKEDGRPACLASIHSGFNISRNDQLPELRERPYTNEGNGENWEAEKGCQSTILYRCAADIEPEQIFWIWPRRIVAASST